MAELIADPFRAARLVLTLRRQGIMDDAVLSALETVDRSVFVPQELVDLAVEDCALPIACGQTITKPSITAHMLKALAISPGKEDRVLLVGSGSGYSAALLSQICRFVYGIERYQRLAVESVERLQNLKVENVSIRHGDGLKGLLEHGPFNRILICGALEVVPDVLFDQLDNEGLLVAPIRLEKGQQVLRIFSTSGPPIDEPCPAAFAPMQSGVSRTL